MCCIALHVGCSCWLFNLLDCFAGMISIEQWRAAIESFQVVITCGCPTKHHYVGVDATCIFVLSVLWCSFVVCTVCLYKVNKLLIVHSNDVQWNPGPVIYETCHNCGYILKRNHVLVGKFFVAKLVRAVQLQVLVVLVIHCIS